jgi:hypothetical protein
MRRARLLLHFQDPAPGVVWRARQVLAIELQFPKEQSWMIVPIK